MADLNELQASYNNFSIKLRELLDNPLAFSDSEFEETFDYLSSNVKGLKSQLDRLQKVRVHENHCTWHSCKYGDDGECPVYQEAFDSTEQEVIELVSESNVNLITDLNTEALYEAARRLLDRGILKQVLIINYPDDSFGL